METLRIDVSGLSAQEVKELTEALRKTKGVEKVDSRVRTRDHAHDPNRMYLIIQPTAAQVVALVVTLAHQAAPLVKEMAKDIAKDTVEHGIDAGVICALHKFVELWNKSKKKEIDAGEEYPLLYDANNRVIKHDKKD